MYGKKLSCLNLYSFSTVDVTEILKSESKVRTWIQAHCASWEKIISIEEERTEEERTLTAGMFFHVKLFSRKVCVPVYNISVYLFLSRHAALSCITDFKPKTQSVCKCVFISVRLPLQTLAHILCSHTHTATHKPLLLISRLTLISVHG